MKVRPRYLRRGAWLALAAALPACGALLGIEEGIPEDASVEGGPPAGDGGRDGTALGDGRSDGRARQDGSDVAQTSQEAGIDGGIGPGDAGMHMSFDAGVPRMVDGGPAFIYVSTAGSATLPCGTISAPCGTVALGLTVAQKEVGDAGTALILVAQGVYGESINLVPGVSIQGGFSNDFKASLPGSEDSGTVITGTSSKTVVGTNLAHPVNLINLTVLSGATANPGESLYGVFLANNREGGAPVYLENIFVIAGPGGMGQPGNAGDAGPLGPGSCSTGGDASTGSVGSAPGVTADVAPSGFSAPGGGQGGRGGNGRTGGAGAEACGYGFAGCAFNHGFCGPTNFGSMMCEAAGAGGCGGGGGYGGAGGGGGGSSIGVFVWNLPLTIKGGLLAASAGGAGGGGGSGGVGGQGAAGAKGGTGTITSGCANNSGNCDDTSTTLTSEAGAPGGQGGLGGTGAQGAGGSSYGIYWGGAAPIFLNVTEAFGPPGAGSITGVGAKTGSLP